MIGMFCAIWLVATAPTLSGEIHWNRIDRADSAECATFAIQYPSFPMLRSGSCNDSISQFVNETIESFRLKVRDANALFENVPNRPFSELTIHTDSAYVSDSIVSCTMSVYLYTVGAAHGYQDYRSFVYDRNKGRMLRPSEFLLTRDRTLRSLIMDNLAARGICYDKWLLQKTPVDNLHINLCGSGILVSFADYQIASYACGPGQIVFGWQSIKVTRR